MNRAKDLAIGLLCCSGRLTITSMIIALGQQLLDWSAAYRIFRNSRMNVIKLFEVNLKICLQQLDSDQLLIGHMDDTIIRKTGKNVSGTSWRRDPLGPAFHTNFVWAQRFLEISISLHDKAFSSPSRAIPIDFYHCPGVKKLSKDATQEQQIIYKEEKKQKNLSMVGLERIKHIREVLNLSGAKERQLLLSVDGSYTNETVLKKLPEKVTLIGRIRKDVKLHFLPETPKTKGRNIVYGPQAPTPEQIRTWEDKDQYPWTQVSGFAAGKVHTFKVKVVKSLKWRAAGAAHTLQAVVIAPLGYRLKKGGKLLYRKPTYLICTDNELDIKDLLQAYLFRWEIEVNFRDEKTIIGAGQAQVRNQEAVANVPAFVVAIHGMLKLANHMMEKVPGLTDQSLPKAKWEDSKIQTRKSTNTILNLFKANVWLKRIDKSFSDFVKNQNLITKADNPKIDPQYEVFYVRR